MTSTIILTNVRSLSSIHTTYNMPTRNKISYRVGRFFARIKTTLQKTEVKISAILSYWTLETVITALAIAALNSFYAAAILTAIYLYGSYALFSALFALVEK